MDIVRLGENGMVSVRLAICLTGRERSHQTHIAPVVRTVPASSSPSLVCEQG